jgi:hypothetical protein
MAFHVILQVPFRLKILPADMTLESSSIFMEDTMVPQKVELPETFSTDFTNVMNWMSSNSTTAMVMVHVGMMFAMGYGFTSFLAGASTLCIAFFRVINQKVGI